MATDTEEKIKVAARNVFKKKGFAATRTRDIAEEAGVNLALLNYYFKSKELLFNEVMFEIILDFKQTLVQFLNDDSLSFEDNLQRLIDTYTELFLREPELPLFVMGELRNNPQVVVEKIKPADLIYGSTFEKQLSAMLGNSSVDATQIFINAISMTFFPFISRPMVQNVCGIDDENFVKMVRERSRNIPKWIMSIIQTDIKTN